MMDAEAQRRAKNYFAWWYGNCAECGRKRVSHLGRPCDEEQKERSPAIS
jgi:hypothetical protein